MPGIWQGYRCLEMASAPEDAEDSSATLWGIRGKASVTLGLLGIFTGLVALILLQFPPLAAPGLLAYTFGLRHAVDVDHIAAIDNVTRKLATGGRQPATVGLFFALGHSTVVTLMCIAVMCAADVVEPCLKRVSEVGGILGATISGTFLLVVGAMNLSAAFQLRAAWKEQSTYGGHTHPIVGFCTRLCPCIFENIRRPWHMYPVGFLFGLGFDTSSEMGLLAAVAMSHTGLPRPAVLLLPLMFTAGMSLVDTLNGILMAWAYGRALEHNMHRMYYNLFLTSTSAVVAISVGMVELLGVLSISLGLEGTVWSMIDEVSDNFEFLGIVVISVFLISLVVALAGFACIFPGGEPPEDPARKALLRYMQVGALIDRSGIDD